MYLNQQHNDNDRDAEQSRGFFKDNGLSIAFFSLGLLCVFAQAYTGFRAYSSSLAESGLPAIAFRQFLTTGTFLDGIFSNWQAAVLQLGTLITLGAFLRQRGAAHSLKPKEEAGHKGDQDCGAEGPPPSGRGWLHDHGLTLAFVVLFFLFLGLHGYAGALAYNEDELLRHHATIAFGAYVRSASFAVSLAQTWEAEFLVMGLYLVLSIYLRQIGSSESKASSAGDDETGEVNE